ncbi:hypothetical protein AN958_12605 [Leucoagaricus sp. SymC.cos]|nr:hypothetical protein AN958_12605 [Leucoagaricus sp. SymC.cos]
MAYRKLTELFQDFGLILKHKKSEVFNFSYVHNNANPPINLGFAPFTSSSPLCPKPYWRYLGFYFDQQLNFKEHVCYWSTKALSTVCSMCILGNSIQGLTPHQKRILYRSCVIPVTTYGY